MYRTFLKIGDASVSELDEDILWMLDINSFGWFSFTQLSLQEAETTMATQDLDGLLFDSWGGDAKIFQAR